LNLIKRKFKWYWTVVMHPKIYLLNKEEFTLAVGWIPFCQTRYQTWRRLCLVWGSWLNGGNDTYADITPYYLSEHFQPSSRRGSGKPGKGFEINEWTL
jgi:hypothetical protein